MSLILIIHKGDVDLLLAHSPGLSSLPRGHRYPRRDARAGEWRIITTSGANEDN